MRTAVYPGSFDPITNGHLDIIERASRLFDHLIVAIAHNSAKDCIFTLQERKELLQEVLKEKEGVEVAVFSRLLVDFVEEQKACAVVRGLRAVTDFDYEFSMFQINTEMYPKADTVFLLAAKEYSFLSSSLLKELARHGRCLDHYTPKATKHALLKKFRQ